MTMDEQRISNWRGVLAGAVILLLAGAQPARANLPLGACCFADGSCQDLMATQCEGAGQDFIGEGTSCATTNCRAPVAAPLLSAAGAVAATSGILGVTALRFRRRRRG